ncbi:substrate-binding domain-containing protein [Kitasatospora sp. NBC_01287]|uniref:substrate-binding domain-containing protein n=1 Tax=Kitasatospora sp. NBC_01287 TaxID=2903573 RepID=UPI00224D25E9|nr:substrate-binding domain-containing protein [Kitasatospora sp. NBC_01287]MCX4747185.1 substrate-binding domain-containing protein [Kitasatospora sp. NBC_01287]
MPATHPPRVHPRPPSRPLLPSRRPRVRLRTTALALSAALALAGCLTGCSGGGSGADAKVTGPISLTYLQKQGDQQYFKDEAAGAKARAAQLGVTLKMVDLGTDADRTVAEERAAIAAKSQGLIVVAPDPTVGPQVVQIAKDAKVALLSSDDELCGLSTDPVACAHQDLVPRVGFSGDQLGSAVGQRAAQEYRQAGWTPADTRILSAWQPDVSVCADRVNAAAEAFFTAAGRPPLTDLPTDNTTTGAQRQAARIIAATPGVKHWLVWGCNDENVQGAITALQQAGVGTGDVIGIGLGAYLACQDWGTGQPTGMRAALYLNGSDVGALAVQTMVDKLRTGKAFPAESLTQATMVDAGSKPGGCA